MKKILNHYIDHTLLKADASSNDIIKLCKEAKKYHFASVCINPSFIPLAKKYLKNTKVKICTVVGFPLGQMTTKAKVFETIDAIENGANEIDMVLNVGKLKENNLTYVKNEIIQIKKYCKTKILKVIIETCLLNKQQIIKACQLAKKAKADFVKTSTGFSVGGAKIEDVRLMRKTVGNKMGVKASGGVRSYQDALAMIKAGANRIGTSNGIKIALGK